MAEGRFYVKLAEMRIFALLTCDSVYIEQQSGKHFVQGHFSSIKVEKFPAVHPALTLFAAMTAIPAGEHTLELRFGLPSDTPPLPPPAPKKGWSLFAENTPPPAPVDPLKTLLEQKITSKGPLERLYLITELKDLSFEKAGEYQLVIRIDGNTIGSIGLTAGR